MFDIIIDSHDISGLLLAYCFIKKVRIAIITKLLNYSSNVESISIINYSSFKILKSLDIWYNLAKYVIPLKNIILYKYKYKKLLKISVSTINNYNYIINDNIGFYILKKILSKHITIINYTNIKSIIFEKKLVTLSLNNEILKTRLLITNNIFNIKNYINTYKYYIKYKYVVIQTRINTELIHHNNIYQVLSKYGIMTFIPLKNNNCNAIYWILKRNMIKNHESYNSIIDNISKLIFNSCNLKDKILTSSVYVEYLSNFIYHRLLLISNAAYKTNLIFGQKLNFSCFSVSIINNLITYLINSNNDIGFYYFLKYYEQKLKYNFISKIIKTKLLYDFYTKNIDNNLFHIFLNKFNIIRSTFFNTQFGLR
ncbi:MAG: hypothetical protein N4P94_00745 [Candidatus Lightella neohaematopini]|nr:hypothetical protein [Candidatus Lightella neohaematopini]